MKFYMAPMEGMTWYIFRNAYHKYFHNIDKYFTPFIASTGLSFKERNDVLPQHNEGIEVVPQILTNKAEDFLEIAQKMESYGYKTVNLNLGCPAGTVVTKGKGAGFLAYTEQLNRFLDEVFSKCKTRISIKTRLGMEEYEEWNDLQEIFNQYPIEELIIHPRVQKDLYRNQVNLAIFEEACSNLKVPVCYNGDIHSVAAYEKFVERFPQTDTIMLGRGIFKNPGLVSEIKGEEKPQISLLKAFHDEVLSGYREIMSGDLNALYKMKEIWIYWGESFEGCDKELKTIKKTKSMIEYNAAVRSIFGINK